VPPVEDRLNFSQITALVVDGDRYSSGIVSQILRGFGLAYHQIAQNGADAMQFLGVEKYDLLITEAVLPDMNSVDLLHWVRRHSNPRIRYMPVVMLTGYAQVSKVVAARDCGANSFVRKPVSPTVLFDHIAWSARTERPFIETDNYVGPCRRFKFGEPPPGMNRRSTDRRDQPVHQVAEPAAGAKQAAGHISEGVP